MLILLLTFIEVYKSWKKECVLKSVVSVKNIVLPNHENTLSINVQFIFNCFDKLMLS